MLTLQNFDTQLRGAIFQRGKDYYESGSVAAIEETGDGIWTAEVEGTETYEVEVELKNNHEIIDSSCTCPYDDSLCKHQVAVYFSLRNEMKSKPEQEAKQASRNVFDKLLTKVSVEECKQFIKQYAARNQRFKTEFELFFADKDDRVDVEAKYKSLLEKIIRNHTDRGYIDYKESQSLAREVDKLLAGGNELVARQNFRDAFALALTVLQQMMGAIENSDDSSGSMGSTITEAIELLQKLAEADTAPVAFKEQLFDFAEEELSDKIYFNYGDFGYQLFSIYRTLAVALRKDEAFSDFIDRAVAGSKSEYESYRKDFFRQQKIEFLQQTGQVEAAEKLVQQSLDIVEVRQGEVNKAIRAKQYPKAKHLIAEGIQLAEKKAHPGTVSQWKEYLLQIAEKEEDKPSIRELTQYFAFHHGFSGEYFHKWKKTFAPAEWLPVIEAHIAAVARRTMQDERSSPNPQALAQSLLYALGPLFIEEKYFDRLLQLVQQTAHIDIALRYHEYLVKLYPAEMLALYLPALEKYGQQVSDRSGYADLVSKIQLVMKDIPQAKEPVMAIARQLKEQFSVKPRRPAMLEELGKIVR